MGIMLSNPPQTIRYNLDIIGNLEVDGTTTLKIGLDVTGNTTTDTLDLNGLRYGAVPTNTTGRIIDSGWSSDGTDLYCSNGGNFIMSAMPTGTGGLPSGALWNNGGIVNIV